MPTDRSESAKYSAVPPNMALAIAYGNPTPSARTAGG